MKQKFLKERIVFFIGVVICMSSCVTQKQMKKALYFSDKLDTAKVRIVTTYEPTFEVGDRLNIRVFALNQASASPYNLNTGGGTEQGGYLVEGDGTILMPQLGKIPVRNKTRKQLADTLTGIYNNFLTDPLVNIQFLNFKILMAGEVGRPGPLSIPDGNLNIFDAIMLVGDLDVTARKDNVLVVRETDGIREFGRINLNSHEVFNSPYYHLKQNDLVYVEMTKNKLAAANNAGTRQNIRFITTAIGIFTTVIALITRFSN